MSNWQRRKLADISTSSLGKMLDKEKNRGTYYPYLANYNVRWGKFDLNKLQLMKFEEHEHERYGLEYGDLVICEGGEPGRCAVWRNDAKNIKIQKALHRLRVNKGFSYDFLYYRMLLASRTGELNKYFIGSTIKHLTGVQLKQIEFDFPVESIQHAISSTLRVLDEKIELNNRINAELEAMAKMLYDYWFVQFDFPDSNGKPYKTSGGKMVYNTTLKREIPLGWTDCQLGNIIERSGTGLNPRDNFVLGNGDNYYVTIKNVNNGKLILDDKCDKVDDNALKIIDRRSQLRGGDILFTSIEPVGVTYFIHEKPTNWNINESVFTLRPNIEKVTSEYLYLLLSSDEMKIFTKNSSSGSVHKGIRHGVLKNYTLAYNGKEIIDEFSNKIKPILKRVYFLDQENQSLTKIRDWLLPLLMNGQVTVK